MYCTKVKSPRGNIIEGVLNLLKQFEKTTFMSDEFKSSMRKSFQNIGCVANDQYKGFQVC